ncbi:LysR family transcriptional regulator [Leucobacter muris]|nr:LysR family transcriptional regulator [Leucobacter muris]
MLNPVHLRTLLEVVRLGSFAGAANRLGYTPSAVSQQMAALEHDSGVRLFERTARSARPTQAAEIMAQHAVNVLAELDALLEAAAGAGLDTREELRLSIYASLAHRVFPDLLTEQLVDEPLLGVRLTIRDPSPAIQALRNGEEVDVSLVYQVGDSGLSWPDSVHPEYLGEDRYRVVVPESWDPHRHGPVSASQLVGRPWVLHHPGSSDIAEIEGAFSARELRPRVVARCDDFSVSLKLIGSGYAASFMPEVALGELPAGVRVLDVPEIALSRRVWALVSRRAPQQPVQRLLRRMREAITRDGAPLE